MKRTISAMVGQGSVNHNSRAFNAKNTDPERSHLNITYCHENIKAVFHELFDEALKRYNDKQTRADRKIEDYYEKIRSSKQENKKDKKKKEKPRAARSAKGKSIEERPKAVNSREEAGHWEMDTVLSAKDGSLERDLGITERATRNQINIKLKNGETASVVAALDALERKLGDLFPVVFQSITVDNGSEFADVEGMERSCLHPGKKRTTVYYCHPYSSSERGSNEKQNGMLRRRHPKGTDFKRVSKKKLRETTEWINNYPRKMFGFHTAAEHFAAAFPGLPSLY